MVTMVETEILLITLEEEVVLATILTEIDIQDLDTALEEIAFYNGWLSREQLFAAGEKAGKNSYGQYLMQIAREHRG